MPTMRPYGKAKLQQYLHNGSVPHDIGLYQQGFPKEGHCPLCEETIAMGAIEDGAMDGEASIMEYDTANGILRLPTCGDCTYEIARRDASREYDPETNREHPSMKLFIYYTEHQLPDDTQRYIRQPNLCVFCDRDIAHTYQHNRLYVPVTADENSYGGIVRVCEPCHNYYGGKPLHHEHEERCVVCTILYPITSDEYAVRLQANTLGKHLCPTCYSINVVNSARFITTSCPDCSATEFIDMSTNNHWSLSAAALKAIKCIKHRTMQNRFPIGRWVVPINKPYRRLIIKQIDSMYQFFIEELDKKLQEILELETEFEYNGEHIPGITDNDWEIVFESVPYMLAEDAVTVGMQWAMDDSNLIALLKGEI